MERMVGLRIGGDRDAGKWDWLKTPVAPCPDCGQFERAAKSGNGKPLQPCPRELKPWDADGWRHFSEPLEYWHHQSGAWVKKNKPPTASMLAAMLPIVARDWAELEGRTFTWGGFPGGGGLDWTATLEEAKAKALEVARRLAEEAKAKERELEHLLRGSTNGGAP